MKPLLALALVLALSTVGCTQGSAPLYSHGTDFIPAFDTATDK
jgi:hypothetical protein